MFLKNKKKNTQFKHNDFGYRITKLLLLFLNSLVSFHLYAAEHTIDLNVGYKTVNFAGESRKAIAVNDQIPAPTLHFKEGDHVTINVYNHLDTGTTIHWHGILLPWQMDGVEGVTQHAIPPGGVYHYQFTLKQAGTYWYHAHTGLQEQRGLYGAFLIDPIESPAYQYTKDYVVVLSDWSNTNPNQIFANLKKDGDYYSPDFPLQPSLVRFIREYRKASPAERQMLREDYKMMQQMRMSIYDISDVAYDTFLLNGQPPSDPWTAPVKVGDVVRLRFVGANAGVVSHVKIPGATMQMVHVQGHDVQPYTVDDFTIAPGETYDVLVKIEKDSPYIIYAESTDTQGAAYGALITEPEQRVNYQQVKPFPTPQTSSREMMSFMMTGPGMPGMNMPGMNMSSKPAANMSTMPGMNMSNKPAANMNTMPGMNMSNKPAANMSTMPGMSNKPAANTGTMPGMNMSSMNKPKSIVAPGHQNGIQTSNMKMKSSMPMNNTMNMSGNMSMNQSMSMSQMRSMQNTRTTTSPGTKYQNMVSPVETNDPNKPVEVITMELYGYMGRFIWFINGVPEYNAPPIIIEPGKRYRIIFNNVSMMHHPMHIHGHFFILRSGHGAYDPLLHTIDVPPGATVVADFDANAGGGQWFFHCHFLYHMMAGMSRVFQYSTLLEEVENKTLTKDVEHNQNSLSEHANNYTTQDVSDLVKHPMAHPAGLYRSTYLNAGEDPFNNVQRLTFKTLIGSDYNKLELYTEDAELNKGKVENADIDVFYWHLLSEFWAIKGGANYYYRPTETPYWQPGMGIEGLMPYFIDTNIRTYFHEGSTKFDIQLSRDTQITNNLFLRTGIRSILATKTVEEDGIGSGLNQMRYIIGPFYRLTPGLSVFFEYENETDYGAFADFQRSQGDSPTQNTYTFGLSFLF